MKRITDDELLARIDALTTHGYSLGPTMRDLVASLDLSELTIKRRIATLVEKGRVSSDPRLGLLLENS